MTSSTLQRGQSAAVRSSDGDLSLHFVGIGGIGMSGIAEVFLRRGFKVSGSDLQASEATQRLAELGAKIYLGHRSEHVLQARVVVISSAVKSDNPEVAEAKRRRIPVIPRAEMLGELMRGKTGLAVAGTHGKTTTTTLLGQVLTEAGRDPTLVIGGRVNALGGTNAKLGAGEWIVAEADESDGSFLHLPATHAIITNIDADHMDHFGSLADIEQAFVDFVSKLPFYGSVVVCGEDAGVKRCLERFTKPYRTYGWSDEWDVWAENVTPLAVGTTPSNSEGPVFGFTYNLCRKHAGGVLRDRITLHVPGRHNVLNSLAAACLALDLGLSVEQIQRGIAAFRGVQRRFEVKWKSPDGTIWVVDDYAHHPTEIAATVHAARQFWKGRIVAIFQPHRYSRTLHARDGFLSAFGECDVVYLTDIYAAGEEPIPGVSSEHLVAEMRARTLHPDRVHWVATWEAASTEVAAAIAPGDLVLCLGAGSITRCAAHLAGALAKAKR